MVTKANAVAGFYSLTNEHLGIIVQRLAERQPSHRTLETIAEISKNTPKLKPNISARELAQDVIFNLDISNGETVGRAVLIAGEADVEVENIWVFRTARNDEDMERGNFELLRKLPRASEPHLFVDECYQVILERPADSDGLANYVHMLKSKHLSPHDLIKVLLTSDEGRNHIETLVIIPYPSAQLKKRNPPDIRS
jgi:hypothetical protein